MNEFINQTDESDVKIKEIKMIKMINDNKIIELQE